MTSPLRILHLTTASEPIAGVERLLIDLARTADRKEWQMSLATVEPSGELQRAVAAVGWQVADLGARGLADAPAAVSRLRGLLRRWQPHVLHTHLHHASVLGALAAGRPGPALVQTRHYSDYMDRFGNPLDRAVDRWAAQRCDALVAVSEAARDHLVQMDGLDSGKVRVVNNGVDWKSLAAIGPASGRKLLAELGAGSGPVVGCTASNHPRNGNQHLLDAFALLHQRHPEAHLVLMGHGTDAAELRARAAALGLDGSVHLAGYPPDSQALMAAFDVYVQPSVEEGVSLAVVEAMAMRRPVVVCDMVGMLRTVEHGVSGLRVPPGQPGTLAKTLAELLDCPDLAARLGRAGAERVREQFSIAAVAAAYHEVYQTVLT